MTYSLHYGCSRGTEWGIGYENLEKALSERKVYIYYVYI